VEIYGSGRRLRTITNGWSVGLLATLVVAPPVPMLRLSFSSLITIQHRSSAQMSTNFLKVHTLNKIGAKFKFLALTKINEVFFSLLSLFKNAWILNTEEFSVDIRTT